MFRIDKKHVIALTLILCMVLGVSTLKFSVHAVTLDVPIYTMEEIDAYLSKYGEEYYAYMIYDEAEESLKPIILEARWRIISKTTWVDDELSGHIEDEYGNIIYIVPKFHDIFPEDWEIETGRELY